MICKIGPQRLTAGVRGLPPLVEGELHARVKADEAMWQLQYSHRLVVTAAQARHREARLVVTPAAGRDRDQC